MFGSGTVPDELAGGQEIIVAFVDVTGPRQMREGATPPGAEAVNDRLTGADGIAKASVAVNVADAVVALVGIPDKTPVDALSVSPSREVGLIDHM